MGLVYIYFNSDNIHGNVKALVREEDIPFFESLGTIYSSPSEIPDEIKTEPEPEPEPDFLLEPEPHELKTDPDKGHGAVGSYQWHVMQIKAMDTTKEVVKYTKEVTGKKLRYAGKTTIAVKIKAIETIKEFMDHDNESK